LALLQSDPNPNQVLDGNDFNSQGELKDAEDITALVVGCATVAESFIASKQWALMWRDADILFQSPRPLETYGSSYVLAPNVQRFTVAKVCNSVVPQLYKGLFFQDPPMVLRPRPGTSQKTTDETTAIMSFLLDECQFKRETRWGLEHLALFGTGIWKWGIERVTKQVKKRTSTEVNVGPAGLDEKISVDEAPKITTTEKICDKPFIEFRPLTRVLVDPSLKVPDIREAGYVIDVRYMDFYQIKELKDSNVDADGKALEGWTWGDIASDEKLKELWVPPVEAESTYAPLQTDQQAQTSGVVHHAEEDIGHNSADPLAKKLEVLEYWDKKRKAIVLNRKKAIFKGENPFKKICFFSANWWNRPKAFYGMGIGMTVGQNQRVDQGTINSILKILSFGVNPIYLRSRDSNSPTQMIRTEIGKILTVDGEAEKAYHLLEQPKVPAETWAALQNSEANTESTTGADQALVQGSSSGPRNGMGRSATGATQLASASATRLDGPLDNFIEQVFKPFLYILDELVYEYITDQEIKDILGEEMGKEYLETFDMQAFHDRKIMYEVLAGSSMAARRVMSQSLTLITQIFENPQIQQFLAEVQGKYIDFEVLIDMWLEASEWKDRQDLIKPLTDQMKQMLAQKQQGQQQAQIAGQMQLNQQKAQLKSEQAQQDNQGRVERDLVREAFKKSAESEVVEGQPDNTGFGDIG
jgi:hypothetical protein